MKNESGQAMSELVFIMPLLLLLTGGAMVLVYMCWQGVKVQEAANYAARVQAQERVAGGKTAQDIDQVNGVNGGADGDVDCSRFASTADCVAEMRLLQRPPVAGGVYGKYYKAIQDLFSPSERNNMLIPAPKIGAISDRVKVIRFMQLPAIFGLQRQSVVVQSTAYGGEDPHMYALPRWGIAGNFSSLNGQLYWQELLKQSKSDDSSAGPE